MLSKRRRRVKWLPLLGFKPDSRDNFAAWRNVGLGCLLVVALLFNYLSISASSADDYNTGSLGASRRLLSNDSSHSNSHGPEWESCDFEKDTSPGAWLFSHTVCILIIFIALAIICDDFFVPSLELISEKLQLSEDVAGATFMAAGSSAPELFTSVAGVAVETDVGVGAIVGSAVFNLLIIIALTAALAGQELNLDWRPLMRDAFFYAMSVGCFIGFAWDGYFVHYEAIILLVLYAFYILLMVFNPRLMDWMASWRLCCAGKVEPADDEEIKDVDPEKGSVEDRKASDKHIFHHHRGSVAGIMMLHNPPIRHTHREGTLSRDNSHVHKTNGDAMRPPGTEKTNDLEMQRRGSGADSTSSGDMLLPAVTLPYFNPGAGNKLTSDGVTQMKNSHSVTSPLSAAPKLPTIESSEDSSQGGSTDSLGANTMQTTAQSSVCTANRLTPVETPAAANHSEAPAPVTNTTVTDNNVADTSVTDTTHLSQGSVHMHNGLRKGSLSSPSNAIMEENGKVPSKDNVENESQAGEEEEDEEQTLNICPCLPCCCPVRTYPPDCTQACEEGGALNWFKLIVRWILFIPAFPFVAIFSWTIPDCSKDHLKKWYIASFLMSVLWIAILSFGMVTLVGRAGCVLNVDTYIMGLVIIAIGTSIPDALSSVLVARDGYGDMAVSNAIGSNVFDVNLGLGLPFIIRIAIDVGAPITLLQGEEWAELHSGHMGIIPHAKFGFILLIILAIALTIFFISKFRLTKLIGISFVCMYVMFLIYAFIQELYCVRKLGIYC